MKQIMRHQNSERRVLCPCLLPLQAVFESPNFPSAYVPPESGRILRQLSNQVYGVHSTVPRLNNYYSTACK